MNKEKASFLETEFEKIDTGFSFRYDEEKKTLNAFIKAISFTKEKFKKFVALVSDHNLSIHRSGAKVRFTLG